MSLAPLLGQLTLDGLLPETAQGAHGAAELPDGRDDVVTVCGPAGQDFGPARRSTPSPTRRRPLRIGIGDIVEAERSEWAILDVDLDRRVVVCRLLRGSHAVRRFPSSRVRLLRAGDAEP